VRPLGLLDVAVSRNAYGSQVESFEGDVRVKLGEDEIELQGVFIRAPVITEVWKPTEAAGWLGSQVVFVVKGHIWGLTFHPELSGYLTLQKRFLKLIV
jgi:pyridoxal 5'-phosphate synthase pdxT subunit